MVKVLNKDAFILRFDSEVFFGTTAHRQIPTVPSLSNARRLRTYVSGRWVPYAYDAQQET